MYESSTGIGPPTKYMLDMLDARDRSDNSVVACWNVTAAVTVTVTVTVMVTYVRAPSPVQNRLKGRVH